MAPELLFPGPTTHDNIPSTKSDIYALAMVVIEVTAKLGHVPGMYGTKTDRRGSER